MEKLITFLVSDPIGMEFVNVTYCERFNFQCYGETVARNGFNRDLGQHFIHFGLPYSF